MRRTFLTLLCLIVPFLARPAFAHGVGAGLIQADHKVVRFYYSDGEPMAYAEVLVFGPDNSKVEFQNGRTDKHGVFAFVPDGPGSWRVVCNDGMGHRAEIATDVEADAPADAPADTLQTEEKTPAKPNAIPVWFKAVLGVSLIFNLAFGIRLFKTSKSSPTA